MSRQEKLQAVCDRFNRLTRILEKEGVSDVDILQALCAVVASRKPARRWETDPSWGSREQEERAEYLARVSGGT